MADSEQVRKRRQRAHDRGDHSLCRASWCDAAPPDDPAPLGVIEDALLDFLSEVQFDPSDPRSVIAGVARQLARACDACVSAAVANELRVVMSYLTEDPFGEPDGLDAIRARYAAKRVEGLVRDTTRDLHLDARNGGSR